MPTPLPSGLPSPLPTLLPRAGVFVSGPAEHTLAEDRELNLTSSFTVALESEPLSDVTLSFSSQLGSVRFNHASVVFGYLNFSVPVAVTMSGVDDAIDQGQSHDDSVLVNVTSLDSWFECDDQLRPACGQAVAYNGFNVTSIPVTVLDDDTAGLVVQLADNNLNFEGGSVVGSGSLQPRVNATFDNRGDPLSPALFSVSLATEPVGTVRVHLDLVGSTGFSALNSLSDSSAPAAKAPSSLLAMLPLDSRTQAVVQSASVELSPSNWSTGAVVAYWGAAASSLRPVCANTSRYCTGLSGRSDEVVTVSAVSLEDTFYNSAPVSEADSPSPSSAPTEAPSWLPALSPVTVRASVARDAADPPAVAGSVALFNNNLGSLSITLDSASNRAGLSGLFACGSLFDFSSSPSTAFLLLGSGSSCAFEAFGTVIKVTLGSSATIVPGDTFQLRPHLLRSSSLPNALTSLAQTVTVGAVGNPPTPFVTLAASSSLVGICDDVSFDASGSSGSGGRPLMFAWHVTSASTAFLANATRFFAKATAAEVQHRVTVPASSMPPGVSFRVSLTVANFLGASYSVDVPVRKLTVPAPSLAISPAVVTGFTRSQELNLVAVAELPNLACSWTGASTSAAASATSIGFVWRELSGRFTTDSLSSTTKNARVLSLPPGTLNPSTTYNFSVSAYLLDFPHVNNTATVEVAVGSQPLVASITGGASWNVGVDSEVTLDGSGSSDPDELDHVPFVYSWTCAASSSSSSSTQQASCAQVPSVMNSSVVTLSAGTLPAGSYAFILTVLKGGAGTAHPLRNATASASIEVVSGTSPLVSLAKLSLLGPNADKVNPGAGYLQLSGSATALGGGGVNVTALTWTAVNADVGAPFVLQDAHVAALSNEVNSKSATLSSVLNLLALTPGSSYTFQLSAVDSGGRQGRATVVLTVNEPPSSGSLSAAPSNGVALSAVFELSALLWAEDDLPLSYVFGIAPVVATTTNATSAQQQGTSFAADTSDATRLFPFGHSRRDAFYVGVTLAQGEASTNYTTGCYTEVFDSLGASSFGSATVRVLPASLSRGALANFSATSSREYLDAQNANKAKQVVHAAGKAAATAVAAAAANSGSSRRGRSLLGSLTSAEKQAAYTLRASLLSDLWATYAITPLTQADIASLLNVLVSIVEVPAEVSPQVAMGAIEFAATTMRASLHGDIGVSSTATSFLAQALSFVLGSSALSNGTTALPVADLVANTTSALALASAAQLHGAFDGVKYSLSSSNVAGGGTVAMTSVRCSSELTSLATSGLSTSCLGSGGSFSLSSTSLTALSFYGAPSEVAASLMTSAVAAGASAVTSSSVVDVRIGTVGGGRFGGLFERSFRSTAQTQAALASRADMATGGGGGGFLLRSNLTVVEISLEGSPQALRLRGLIAPARVTLEATVPFNNTSTLGRINDHTKTLACPTDGAPVLLACPLGAVGFENNSVLISNGFVDAQSSAADPVHVCDWALHGNGGAYAVEVECPMVVPTCLWWDEAADGGGDLFGFSSDGCTVVAGYTETSVTCECNHLDTRFFALGANTTAPRMSALTTKSPTPLPSPLPSPAPSHAPSPVPSGQPTSAPTFFLPTPKPTRAPTFLPTPEPTPVPSMAPTFEPTILPSSVPTGCGDRVPYCEELRLHDASVCAIQFCLTDCPWPHKCDWTCGYCFQPTPQPTLPPSPIPSLVPSLAPTLVPTQTPTPQPTLPPSSRPSFAPTLPPTPVPSAAPRPLPSPTPTATPTLKPIPVPTPRPTMLPSSAPTLTPTWFPTPEFCKNVSDPSGNSGSGSGYGRFRATLTGSAESGWPRNVSLRITYSATVANEALRGLDVVAGARVEPGQGGETSFALCVASPTCAEVTFSSSSSGVAAAGTNEVGWVVEDSFGTVVSGGFLASGVATTFCVDNGRFQNSPTMLPTSSSLPTQVPAPLPSSLPLPLPTAAPYPLPSPPPSLLPSPGPTQEPSPLPTPVPSLPPTSLPSPLPSPAPTPHPTLAPFPQPTPLPTMQPTQRCRGGQFINRTQLAGLSCFDCPAGRYTNQTTIPFATECSLCPPGEISGTAAEKCTKCPDGKFSDAQRLTCGTCPAGTYVNRNVSICVDCPVGQYAPSALDDSCLDCGPGFETTVATGAVTCSDCSPGFYSTGDTVFCQECAPGRASSTRAASCTFCEPGTRAENSAADFCLACDAGKSTEGRNGSTTCVPCPTGTYSVTRSSECYKCDPGFYTDMPGLSSCKACAAGTFTDKNRTKNCTSCPLGKSQGASGQSFCTDCEPGKFAASKQSSFCDNCAVGYKSTGGQPSCAICEEGYYWGVMKKEEEAAVFIEDPELGTLGWGCEVCPDNAFCAAGIVEGDLFQPIADAGYWIDRAAAVKDPRYAGFTYPCTRDTCGATDLPEDPTAATTTARRRLRSRPRKLTSSQDESAVITGTRKHALQMSPLEPWRRLLSTATTAAFHNPSAFWLSFGGYSDPLSQTDVQLSSRSDDNIMEERSGWEYSRGDEESEEVGEIEVTDLTSTGHVSEEVLVAHINGLALGTRHSQGPYRSVSVLPAEMLRSLSRRGSTACAPKPRALGMPLEAASHGSLPDSTSDPCLSFNNPAGKTGDVSLPRNRAAAARPRILVVSNRDGRVLASADQACLLLANFSSPDCNADLTCAAGSTGPMCGACEPGYSFSATSRRCQVCGDSQALVESFVLMAVMFLVLLVLYTIRTGDVVFPKFLARLFGCARIHIPLIGIVWSMDRGAIKLLWATFQIVVSVSFNLDVTFPEPYGTVSGLLSFVQVDFLSMECLQGGYYYGVYVASTFPLFLCLFIWGLFLVRLIGAEASALVSGKDSKKVRDHLFAEHMHGFLLLVYLVVPPVSNIQFKALSCTTLENGDSYLRADTSVDCNSEGYAFFRSWVLFFITIYQSLPLMYILLLCRVRDKLIPQANAPQLALQIRDSDPALASLKFLFQDYKCERWYFEVVDMYRRIIFLGVIPLMGSDSAGRAYAGAALGLLSCVFFRESIPFRVPFTNFLAVVAQYVILLSFMAALLVATNSLNVLGLSDFALGTLLSTTNVFIVLLAVYIGYKQYQRVRAEMKAEMLAKTIKLEWAIGFSANKFNTTFQYVDERSVASSHMLCFYYTSLKEAKHIVKKGKIPALKLDMQSLRSSSSSLYGGGGIVVSLKGPQEVKVGDPLLELMGRTTVSFHSHDTDDDDESDGDTGGGSGGASGDEGPKGSAAVAMSREVVFCLNLPRSSLFPFPPELAVQSSKAVAACAKDLRVVPGDFIQGLGTYVPPPSLPNAAKEKKNKKKAQKGNSSSTDAGGKDVDREPRQREQKGGVGARATHGASAATLAKAAHEKPLSQAAFMERAGEGEARTTGAAVPASSAGPGIAMELDEPDEDGLEHDDDGDPEEAFMSSARGKEKGDNVRAVLSLPSTTVVRAYQLVADDDCTGPKLRLGDYLYSPAPVQAALPEPSPDSVKAFLANLNKKERKKKLAELKSEAREKERLRKLALSQKSSSRVAFRRVASKFNAMTDTFFSSSSSSSSSSIRREEEAVPSSEFEMKRKVTVVQPATCAEYLEAMAAVRKACAEEGTVPLYHYTMLAVAPFILGGGFRMSTQGQGDGGVYFSTLGPSSYNLGADDYEENIIVDCFGKERLDEYRSKHKLDLLFVYAVNPKCVEQAPGGRENAKMVPKAHFKDFAAPSKDGNYFLRPDYIKAAFLLDGTSGYPKGLDQVRDGMEKEKANDAKVQQLLKECEQAMKGNAASAQAVKVLGFGKKKKIEESAPGEADPQAAAGDVKDEASSTEGEVKEDRLWEIAEEESKGGEDDAVSAGFAAAAALFWGRAGNDERKKEEESASPGRPSLALLLAQEALEQRQVEDVLGVFMDGGSSDEADDSSRGGEEARSRGSSLSSLGGSSRIGRARSSKSSRAGSMGRGLRMSFEEDDFESAMGSLARTGGGEELSEESSMSSDLEGDEIWAWAREDEEEEEHPKTDFGAQQGRDVDPNAARALSSIDRVPDESGRSRSDLGAGGGSSVGSKAAGSVFDSIKDADEEEEKEGLANSLPLGCGGAESDSVGNKNSKGRVVEPSEEGTLRWSLAERGTESSFRSSSGVLSGLDAAAGAAADGVAAAPLGGGDPTEPEVTGDSGEGGSDVVTVASVLSAAKISRWREFSGVFGLNDVGVDALYDDTPRGNELLLDLGMTKVETRKLKRYLRMHPLVPQQQQLEQHPGGGGSGGGDGTRPTVGSVLVAAKLRKWREHAEAFSLNGVGVEALYDDTARGSELLSDLGLTKAEVKKLRKYVKRHPAPLTVSAAAARHGSPSSVPASVQALLLAAGFYSSAAAKHGDALSSVGIRVEALYSEKTCSDATLLGDVGFTKVELHKLRKYTSLHPLPPGSPASTAVFDI